MEKTKVHFVFVAFSWRTDEGWHFKMECESSSDTMHEDALDFAIAVFEENFIDATFGFCVFDGRTGHLICISSGEARIKE